MTEDTFRTIVQSYIQRGSPLAEAVGYAAEEAADCNWRIKRLRRLAKEFGVSLESALGAVGESVCWVAAIRHAETAARRHAASA